MIVFGTNQNVFDWNNFHVDSHSSGSQYSNPFRTIRESTGLLTQREKQSSVGHTVHCSRKRIDLYTGETKQPLHECHLAFHLYLKDKGYYVEDRNERF